MVNLYVGLMSEVVEYIEENLCGQLGLGYLSKRFNVSEFHFDRLFNVVVGKGLKQYITGRKLALALERLENSSDNIIDIALDLGFEYPEVFSRTFKKHYGISPSAYRMVRSSVEALPRASVISRNLVAFQGKVTLKADFIPVEPFVLHGLSLDVDTNSPDFKESLEQLSDMANKKTVEMKHLNQDKFYSVVNCHGDGSDIHTVFSGREAMLDNSLDLDTRRVPGGWYAKFTYKGDMFDIRETFVDDLYRWIAVKEVELVSNGVGMISVFDEEYIKSKIVKILIPVKEPKT